MRELSAEELGQVLHLDLMDLLNIEPSCAGWHDKRPGSVGSHLLLQHHLLLLSHGRFSICLAGHSIGHATINDVLLWKHYLTIIESIFGRKYGHFLVICSNATRWSIYDLKCTMALFGALSIVCLI